MHTHIHINTYSPPQAPDAAGRGPGRRGLRHDALPGRASSQGPKRSGTPKCGAYYNQMVPTWEFLI